MFYNSMILKHNNSSHNCFFYANNTLIFVVSHFIWTSVSVILPFINCIQYIGNMRNYLAVLLLFTRWPLRKHQPWPWWRRLGAPNGPSPRAATRSPSTAVRQVSVGVVPAGGRRRTAQQWRGGSRGREHPCTHEPETHGPPPERPAQLVPISQSNPR